MYDRRIVMPRTSIIASTLLSDALEVCPLSKRLTHERLRWAAAARSA
ncbi:hypothetical protein ES5_17858 [Dietzia cinnamea P4]|nr:hypothetical protein ES5_17858 [Dietzia cinnamea P4]